MGVFVFVVLPGASRPLYHYCGLLCTFASLLNSSVILCPANRGGYSMAIPQTSVSDSGEYSFGCVNCGIISSLTLSLLVGPPLSEWQTFFSKPLMWYQILICTTLKSYNVNTIIMILNNIEIPSCSSFSHWLPSGRPSKPHLKYIPGRRGFLPNFQCSSEGNPKPEIKWFNNLDKTG